MSQPADSGQVALHVKAKIFKCLVLREIQEEKVAPAAEQPVMKWEQSEDSEGFSQQKTPSPISDGWRQGSGGAILATQQTIRTPVQGILPEPPKSKDTKIMRGGRELMQENRAE